MDDADVHPEIKYHTVPLDRRKPSLLTEDGDQGDTCRICRGEATPKQPLFYPCKCSGSIKFVHQDCLLEWLSHSQKKYCELCKTPFRFTKLYDESMPATLPTPLFLRQLGVHAFQTTGRWLRYLFVTFIWTCWLPWSIRQIWRGLFLLADGSWVSLQDLKQMASTEASVNVTTANSTNLLNLNSTASQSGSASYFDPIGELFNLLTGAPLLKGLLRLLTPKPPSAQISASTVNVTDHSSTMSSQSTRQPSLLSNVQSLNSLTKYRMVNNGLIDILEGQLICLSIIAAFILVFLIREWVINQQPILNMPNPNQAEPQPVPAVPDEEGRQAARRRRRGLRRFPDPDGPADNRIMDLAQRPIAVPRPRRAATDETVHIAQQSEEANDRPNLPPRSSSLVPVLDHPDNVFELESEELATLPLQSSLGLQDLESPPLQRGMFDEMAGIRRNIEERAPLHQGIHGDESSADTEESNSANNDTPSSSSMSQPENLESDGVQRTDFIFGRPLQTQSDNETGSNAFTFSSPFAAEPMHELNAEPGGLEAGSVNFEDSSDPWAGVPLPVHTEDPDSEDAQTPAASSLDLELSLTEADDTEVRDDHDNHGVEDLEQNADDEPDSYVEQLAKWLWHMEEIVPVHEETTVRAHGDGAEAAHGRADLLPAANANMAAPANLAAPAHEPNVQPGADMNDANAFDDAEDLEGILELIGMEGPLAGMIQNIIFSVFLITLTLSASVWCPYIWGKIAILIMSNPFGVFVKAPLYFVSKCGNIMVDVILFLVGLVGFALANLMKVFKLILAPAAPSMAAFFQMAKVEIWSMSISQNSGQRLERALSGTFIGLRPDLPTFSMQSHHCLQVFKRAFLEVTTAISNDIMQIFNNAANGYEKHGIFGLPKFLFDEIVTFPAAVRSTSNAILQWWQRLSHDLQMRPLSELHQLDLSLIEWTTQDKVIAVLIGYAFFAAAGFAYLKISHYLLGLRKDEKIEGMFADSLRQAGGVLKVIVIIGIEMIAFPLYCGLLLDLALLPLFKEASFQSRLTFMTNSPITFLFIHWFVGTCYMFNFALFVSMCRKIMRKGVLYFIRDPDDPTFHPVRDVLERPVITQLGKIAFSALVYGGLVVVCLGGVVWAINSMSTVLPIQWAISEPRLAFPVDIIFYNFTLPFIWRKAEPSKRTCVMYEWWFRRCARTLRLSHFLFGEERQDEKQASRLIRPSALMQSSAIQSSKPNDIHHHAATEDRFDGKYVRAPASDSVRVPKGTKVFVEVNEHNERIDGQPDRETGMHGKNDDRFTKIYIPTHFRARVSFFVFLVWLFAASTGVVFTVVPLLVGRHTIRLIAASTAVPNDLYALTIGVHICGIVGYGGYVIACRREQLHRKATSILSNSRDAIPRIFQATKYVLELAYLFTAIFIVVPFAMSLITELYVHMPVYTYFSNKFTSVPPSETSNPSASSSSINPTIFILQTWTLGLLYLRLALRFVISSPSGRNRAPNALRGIIRNGYFHPDVALASRALVLPALTICIILLAAPVGFAKLIIVATGVTNQGDMMQIYRYSYPVVLGMAMSTYLAVGIRHKIEGWSVKVRDEVYLRGELLHNFTDRESERKKKAVRVRVEKGKARAIDPMDADLVDGQPVGRGSDGLEGAAVNSGPTA